MSRTTTAPTTWISGTTRISQSSQHHGMFLLTDILTNKWWNTESTADQMLKAYPPKEDGKTQRRTK